MIFRRELIRADLQSFDATIKLRRTALGYS
jgi:hypothetical protein